ncbi:MAG: histidine phosphatase family protein [Lamprobacter sp.]|uniref:SixA phosphatase family protein n=1 Tax=Lamprobacter sp. TaxID=3100796 RepID=UPI002B25C2CC|nr:histidine phosphatase family protein [Lamprobacter sp.]MEA3639173.1 histidine phosphatase family protein [Lamprobacter sp.]
MLKAWAGERFLFANGVPLAQGTFWYLSSPMARELLLLRHAKSDWDTDTGSDIERPLAKRGKRDAPRIGEWLYREGLVPSLILSSTAERARETTLRVCKGLDYKKRDIKWEPAIYEADLETLLRLLADYEHAPSTVLMVGHNPGLEDLLRYLAEDDLDERKDEKLLPTAALARLEMPDDWCSLEAGSAVLSRVIRPKALK